MSKYEFLVHGDDRNYQEINPRFRLRKYGSWLIEEKIEQEEQAKERSRQILSVVALARKIAKEKGIEVDAAFLLINNPENADTAAISAEYVDEIAEILNNALSQTQQDAQILTYFISERGQGLIEDEWTDLSDWDQADTNVLDESTRDKIVEFINSEQSGGDKVNKDDDDDNNGTEGNAKKRSTSGTKPSENVKGFSSTKTTGTPATQELQPVA